MIYDKKFGSLFGSQRIVREMKPRRLRQYGYVAQSENTRNANRILVVETHWKAAT
jgi:hypothetical protein